MAQQPWETVDGRCGACRRFERDFDAGGGRAYGHCGVKPRRGSIASTDYKCDVYEPAEDPEREDEPPKPRPRPARDPFDVSPEPPPSPPPQPERASHAPSPVVVRKAARDVSDGAPSLPPPPGTSAHEGAGMDRRALRRIVQEAIDESLGISEVEMLDRYRGGELVIRSADSSLQEKSIPIDVFFHKVVMVRDNLRVLEQKLNQHPKLDDADRVSLQQYVTRCYGSLTTFNVLFKRRDDHFKGTGR